MKPTKKYKLIDTDQELFSLKKNIFIDQKNKSGEDFDFAIYKPQLQQILLIQAKYKISSKTLKKKSLFVKNAQKALDSFNNLLTKKIGEVYLLFISSVHYNYYNKQEVIKHLNNYRINCLFYSVEKKNFILISKMRS